MENKSTANKWLIVTVIVMSIIIVVMATWIIAGTMYKDKDFQTKGDSTGIRLTSVSDVDKLDIDSSLKKLLKSKVGRSILEREGEPIIDRAYGKYAAVYGLTNAYTIIGPKSGTSKIAIVAGTQQGGMPCSDLKLALVPSRLVDGKCEVSGSSQTYSQD